MKTRFDTVQVRSQIFMFGHIKEIPIGGTEISTAHQIDTVTKNCIELEMPYEFKQNPCLVNVSDKYIISIGGVQSGHTDKCSIYNIAQKECYRLPYLIHELDWITALLLNDRVIYTMGGCNGSGGSPYIHKLDIMDMEAGWSLIKYNEDSKFYNCDCGVVQDSNITAAVFGGHKKADSNYKFYPYQNYLKTEQKYPFKDNFRQRKPIVYKGKIYSFEYDGDQIVTKNIITQADWKKCQIYATSIFEDQSS